MLAMKLPFYWIDAFTDRVFSGNPAGVVPLGEWLDSGLLQRMAGQHGLSETAYLVRKDANRYDLRWFTPGVEVDLCGHATLAAAHVLFNELGLDGSRVTFDSRSGPLFVDRREAGRLALNFPSRPAAAVQAPPDLVSALGCAPEWTGRAATMWLCVFARAADVLGLSPDFAALAALKPGRVIVTAPGDAPGVDFVSRFFAPDAGIPEDPVTGSAHCTLMPYWTSRLGRASLHARQVSRRGGELWCSLSGDRVEIAGQAKTYIRGEIELP
jgi:PhzF family phenazine biosynthesis protein